MLCRDVIKIIEQSYPPRYAMEWDNVGLLAGRDDREVKRIYIALDATDEVIGAAVEAGADMLITHHPLIFRGMKRINNEDFIGARVIKLIQNDISYYAMHTNYDVLGMAALSGRKMGFVRSDVLDVTAPGEEGKKPEGIGRVGELTEPVSLKVCARLVKERFCLSEVKVFGSLDKIIHKIAICPGAGSSVIGAALEAGADVLVTGDIGHHDGIDAVARHLAVIDAGHYGLEHIFIEDMKSYLQKYIPEAEIIGAPICHPFQMV